MSVTVVTAPEKLPFSMWGIHIFLGALTVTVERRQNSLGGTAGSCNQPANLETWASG